MSLPERLEAALPRCRDQQSFFEELLHKTLEWPIPQIGTVEEISYSLRAGELQAAGIEQQVVDARAWQIQRLETNQPWGVFVLEFKRPNAISSRRGMAGALRKILRGVGGAPRRDV